MVSGWRRDNLAPSIIGNDRQMYVHQGRFVLGKLLSWPCDRDGSLQPVDAADRDPNRPAGSPNLPEFENLRAH